MLRLLEGGFGFLGTEIVVFALLHLGTETPSFLGGMSRRGNLSFKSLQFLLFTTNVPDIPNSFLHPITFSLHESGDIRAIVSFLTGLCHSSGSSGRFINWRVFSRGEALVHL